MMKSEFEALLGKTVSNADYNDIQQVYTYHPLVTVPNEKQKIVDLYLQGGIGLIRSLVPDARRCEELEQNETIARMDLQDSKDNYENAQKALKEFRQIFQP